MIRNKMVHSAIIALYALILPWPVWVLVSYVVFDASLRVILPLALVALGFILGLVLLYKLVRPVQQLSKGHRTLWGVLLGLSFITSFGSFAYVYVPVLLGGS